MLTALEVSGELTRQHYLGDPLDTAGLTFTAVWSTGKREEISAEQITFSGYNSNTQGVQTVTCTYEGVRCEIEVTVLRPVVQDETITVYLTLLGDTAHGPGGTVHTQRAGNLETWISRTSYTVDPNATVWTVLKTALDGNSLQYDNPSGNYVVSITRGGVELAEFTNGTNSGWIYTINGVRSLLGVSEQFLNNGDVIVFHYTDDFTKESGSEDWGGGTVTPPDTPKETLSPTITPDASGEAKAEIGVQAVKALKGGLKAGLPAADGQVLVIVEPDGTETVVKKSITEDGRIDALLSGSCTVKLADNRKEFDDVTAGVWYDGAVDFASSRELFLGVSESAFAPDLNMSRGMLATMLWRYAKDLGLDVTASDDLDAFADGDAVSGYASDAVKWAVGAGLIQGKDGGRLDPAGDATRAEVAMILERMVRVIVA